jgi:ribosome maturation factor RimP
MGIGLDPKKEYEDLIETAAEMLGFSVYEKSIRLKGENSSISVKIDKMGVISVEDCERYSRELSRLLDENGSLPNFSLEISSPGLDRKLSNKDDFVRFVNAPVKVVYDDNGGKCAKGKLLTADENSIVVLSDGREVSIIYGAITRAHLDY